MCMSEPAAFALWLWWSAYTMHVLQACVQCCCPLGIAAKPFMLDGRGNAPSDLIYSGAARAPTSCDSGSGFAVLIQIAIKALLHSCFRRWLCCQFEVLVLWTVYDARVL